LVAARIGRRATFHCLHGVAGKIEQYPKQLVIVGLDGETALHRTDPADR
jgi:hypothetical protein